MLNIREAFAFCDGATRCPRCGLGPKLLRTEDDAVQFGCVSPGPEPHALIAPIRRDLAEAAAAWEWMVEQEEKRGGAA